MVRERGLCLSVGVREGEGGGEEGSLCLGKGEGG